MAKYILEAANVNWLAIMALLTFFFVFSVALVMVIGRGKKSYEEVERQPLVDTYTITDKTEAK